jgi:hypothetical protein
MKNKSIIKPEPFSDVPPVSYFYQFKFGKSNVKCLKITPDFFDRN